jgi:hypothetical protein
VVRVSTNLHVLWDRARLEVGLAGAVPAATSLPPDSADVHFRGFSEPVLAPVSGPRLDHGRLRPGPPGWNPPAGTYTRHGDVMSLLEESDDRYVVMASGDECTVRWRADRLPAPAPGRERTYFLTLDGWAKDGSPNTAESATVTPWPFHAMSAYPPPPDERYPPDALHVAYLTEWNTRPAPRLTPDLAAKAASAPRAETAAVSAEESP